MADTTITSTLTSYEQIQANHERYADKFSDANAEIVNSETFLNLLVAEMTNQDPLEPTSNTEFVTQMAQFTQLQYAQDSSTYAKANYAASLVGKTVTAIKMDGAEQVTKTGVVENVTKSGDTYIVKVDGVSFDISKITAVSETASKDTGTSTDTMISTGSALGDQISRASMMIGLNATVQAQTSSGKVVDAGTINAIQIKNGEIHVVINDISYKLTDVVEVAYPDYNIPSVEDTQSGENAATAPEQPEEVKEELAADETIGADIEDIEDPI